MIIYTAFPVVEKLLKRVWIVLMMFCVDTQTWSPALATWVSSLLYVLSTARVNSAPWTGNPGRGRRSQSLRRRKRIPMGKTVRSVNRRFRGPLQIHSPQQWLKVRGWASHWIDWYTILVVNLYSGFSIISNFIVTYEQGTDISMSM